MFSNKGKDKEVVAATPQTQMPAGAKRPLRSAAAPSIISADLIVTGTLSSSGDIQIDGRIEGDVRSAGLVIGEKAFIQGDIVAEEVTIRGRVEGSIRAHKVLLANTCHVEGNIMHEAFAVETGAFFEGNCRHSENPLADGESRRAAAEDITEADAPTVVPPPLTPVNGGASYTALKS